MILVQTLPKKHFFTITSNTKNHSEGAGAKNACFFYARTQPFVF